ncbi:MAG TPA: oxalate/formate MFS antiporter [Steroidobacteraceae bacterium]|nr:oxalate/formate MFS antiporter [Steroidobacteraceae bacterium]
MNTPPAQQASAAQQAQTTGFLGSRWMQLILGLICMMAISSPQYVWTLFTKPLMAQIGVSLTQLQVTFSIFIVLQTFLSPLQGYLIEKFGPKLLLATGAVMTGLSWVLASSAETLRSVYLTYGVLGGIGTGIIYVGIVGLMVAWFPDRRGMAAGVVAAGYGMGAVLSTFPVTTSIAKLGYQPTLLHFGLIFGAVAFLAALGMKQPPKDWMADYIARNRKTQGQKSGEMLRTPVFWLMFLMMTMMSTSGLMVISQMASFSRDFGIVDATILGVGALPLALTLDRITNGLTRPFFGWVSDRIGRERTMFMAFGLEAMAMTLWLLTRQDALLFVLFSGIVFFGWGEIFSLFPSTLTDTFGEEHATTNYGFLYMAQGIGSIFGGPLAARLHEASGSWIPVFAVVISLDVLTALLAIAVLRPMRTKYIRANASMH